MTVDRARGSVTAELALALPTVVLLLGVVCGVGQVVTAQVRCVDAARAAARVAARGEPAASVRQVAATLAPEGSAIDVHLAGGAGGDGGDGEDGGAGGAPATRQVWVAVRASVRLPLPGGPAVVVSGRAVGALEETLDAGPG